MYPSVEILKKSCKKFNYKFDIIDDVSNSLFQVSNWEKYFFANNQRTGMFPINNHFSASVVADKAFCYQVLNKYKFHIPRWNHFFMNNKFTWDIFTDNSKGNIEKFIKKLVYPVFVKPNNWSLWRWAEVIYNDKELKKHLNEIKKISDICIIQEYIKAPEYRIFVVNWEIQFSYKRSAASVKWDWKSSIKKLLKKSSNSIWKKNNFLLSELKNKNLQLDSILDADTSISLHSKTNISAGWDISELKVKHWKKVKKWIQEVVSKFDIWVTGIDVFAPNGINSPKDFIIIELNSNPSLVWIYKLWYRKLVYKVWKKILESYFWIQNKYTRKYRNISNINIKNTDKKKYKKIKSSM
jgi:glutathione synthase/RimK-type ligase-like ATP-grasp enzyme